MNHKYKNIINVSVASFFMAATISAQAATYSIGTVFGKDHASSIMSDDFSKRLMNIPIVN